MKIKSTHFLIFPVSFLFFMFLNFSSYGQETPPSQPQPNQPQPQPKNDFWDHVHFGGGIGLSIGNGYTDITVAPSAIYSFNQYVACGAGLNLTYSSQNNYYTSGIYGINLISLFNPIPQAQLSVELEQSYVNTKYDSMGIQPSYTDNYWNTGLFLGAGYVTKNVTIGVRYNVLYDNSKTIYGDAFMPFVRVYF